jgi:stage V sporulation protein G
VASITIEDCFVVHDIKVIEGTEGFFIAMPSRKTNDGEYKDIAHPINTETRKRSESLYLKRLRMQKERKLKHFLKKIYIYNIVLIKKINKQLLLVTRK